MRIDEVFISEIGLSEMPEAEKRAFMEHAQEELEVRVGERISRDLTQAQLDEFEGIQDDAMAVAWLEQNAPGFRKAVKEVFATFKAELLAERERILGTR